MTRRQLVAIRVESQKMRQSAYNMETCPQRGLEM
jgi:hypothetical protein